MSRPDKLTAPLWNAYFPEALAIIRETNPDRTVVIGPASWNSLFALGSLRLPPDDRNIIVTVHYYNPFRFTHQGADWTPDVQGHLGRPLARHGRRPGRHAEGLRERSEMGRGRKTSPVPGGIGAYDKAEMASRARYTAAIARTAESLGWSWAYWQLIRISSSTISTRSNGSSPCSKL